MTNRIPENIAGAVNALLAPYGYDLSSLLAEHQASEAQSNRYVSIREAMQFLGISRSLLWRLIKDGRITSQKLTNSRQSRVFIHFPSLQAFAKSLPDSKAILEDSELPRP